MDLGTINFHMEANQDYSQTVKMFDDEIFYDSYIEK